MSAATGMTICLVSRSGLTLFAVTSRDDKRHPGKKYVGSHSFAFGSNRATFSNFNPRIKRIHEQEKEARKSKENGTARGGGKEA